jgi:hypothetical protein
LAVPSARISLLDVAPDIAGLFGDDAEKAISKLAGAV